MEKTMSIEEFYRHKLNWMPDNLKKEIGHFNVFNTEDCVGPNARSGSYSRKDFYKIGLSHAHGKVYYADRVIEIRSPSLMFANPMVPYTWELTGGQVTGFFCIFTESFFDHFGHIKQYPMFQPGADPVFALSGKQVSATGKIFKKMLEEIASDYMYKYDVLRNLVLELVHSAIKMQPAMADRHIGSNASVRVSSAFMELLERQFPIESQMQQIGFRSPVEFAGQLAVHVNHLNRSLKETTGKTTTQLIADRVVQEARALLKHTDWNISEIAYCLGFEELSHFINFFKKNAELTPRSFRSLQA